MSRFDFIVFDKVRQEKLDILKDRFELLEQFITSVLGPGTYQHFAVTALEMAYTWCGRALKAEQQSEKNSRVKLLEEDET